MSPLRQSDLGSSLLIGEVSRRSGRAPSAIRYYEELGLIELPPRIGGRRRYPAEVLRTLAVIDTCQRAGLSLEEIRLLLKASEDAVMTETLRAAARRRLPELITSIERAQQVRRWLEAAAGCECPVFDDCPLFEASLQLPAEQPTQPRCHRR